MLHHIAIIASERERTLRFYQALGFRVEEEHIRPEKKDTIIFLKDDETTLEIFIKSDCPKRPSYPEAYGLRHLALKVGSVKEVAERMSDLGYQVEPIRNDTFNGAKMTFVADPDGLPIELHE